MFSEERRRQLVEFVAAEGLTIVEDDPYRELAYDGPPPDSLWSISSPGTVIRLGTFSKSLAPGMRVGFITADAPTAERIGLSGVLDSGGAISHFSSLVVAEYADSGAFESNLERLRSALRERRSAMLEALDENLAGLAQWRVPAGGYFLWLTLPNGMSAQRLLPIAERHGTTYVPGSVFHVDQFEGDSALRLAFSRHSPDELREAVRRLGEAVREASAGTHANVPR
jgi:DNA-binding transcriptional MocR family regulator